MIWEVLIYLPKIKSIMSKSTIFGLFATFALLVSCQVNVPMNAEYLNKPSKVGIFVHVNDPKKHREGSQGLLDLAVTSGDKYQPMLDLAKEKITFRDELISIYSESLKAKGKEVVIIDEVFDPKIAAKFKGDKAEGKKYSYYDLRNLKEKYGVDDVIFVNVNWGVLISYYSMIETGRAGYIYLDNNVVNTADNTLYFAQNNVKMEIIKGKWNTPPNYENAFGKIADAVNKAIEVERNIFK